MSIETFEYWSLIIGIGTLCGFMAFIVYDLAKKSQAGKYGAIVLFGVLGLGVFGFAVKGILHWMLG